jgi:hypothetical protein
LGVELIEEGCRDPDDSAINRHHCLAR